MDDTIACIIQASAALDPAERPWFIARQAITAARKFDAGGGDQTPDSELLAWFTGVRNA